MTGRKQGTGKQGTGKQSTGGTQAGRTLAAARGAWHREEDAYRT